VLRAGLASWNRCCKLSKLGYSWNVDYRGRDDGFENLSILTGWTIPYKFSPISIDRGIKTSKAQAMQLDQSRIKIWECFDRTYIDVVVPLTKLTIGWVWSEFQWKPSTSGFQRR
jgi:hypothetical protein